MPNSKIHGTWAITLVGNVLVRTTAGNFNEAGTQACYEETKTKVPHAMPWAGLTNASLWELSTSASLKTFPTMRNWAFENGCVCVAVVIPSPLHTEIHRRQTGNFPPEMVSYFATLKDACAWLTEKGFPFTPNDYPHNAFVEKIRNAKNTGSDRQV